MKVKVNLGGKDNLEMIVKADSLRVKENLLAFPVDNAWESLMDVPPET